MDPLTHAAMGAATGLVVAPADARRAGASFGALVALLPDVDVFVASSSDPLLGLEVHRAYTHALLLAPLLALVVAPSLGLLWTRALTLRRRVWIAALAIVGHDLLDACTSYGVRLLWPVLDVRTAWCVVAVVDPVPTLALLVGATLAWRRRSARPAALALAVLAGYLALGAVQHARAHAVALQLARSRGEAPAAIVVKPTLANLVLWRAVTRAGAGGDTLRADGVWLGPTAAVYPGATATRARPTTPDGRRFGALTGGWTIAHPDHPSVLGDARYAMLPDELIPLWGVEPSADARTPTRWRTFRRTDRATRQRFGAMLWGAGAQPVPRD